VVGQRRIRQRQLAVVSCCLRLVAPPPGARAADRKNRNKVLPMLPVGQTHSPLPTAH
jgi:hypothetical protein